MKELKAKHKELLDKLTERLADYLLGERLPLDIFIDDGDVLVIPAGRKVTKPMLRRLAAAWRSIELDPSPIRNRILQVVSKFEHELDDLEHQMRNPTKA